MRNWVEPRATAELLAQHNGLGVTVQPSGESSFANAVKNPSAHYVRGIGIRQRSTYGFAPTSATYVMLGAALFDSRSRQLIAMVNAQAFQLLPFVALEAGLSLKPAAEGDARASIKAQIDATVLELLSKLGLRQ